jgi:glycerate dehydrogenase
MQDPACIVILDGHTINPGDISWTPIESAGNCVVHERTPAALVAERCKDADVVLTSKVKLDSPTLQQLHRLKYIQVLATGYDNVDVASAGRRGIPVANVPGYAAQSVAQTAFGLLLELTVGIGMHDAAVKSGEWVRCPDHSFWKRPIVELAGLTLGILGYGANGRAIARIATAFGMQLIAYTPRLPAYAGPVSIGFVSLEQLFARSDVVVLCCPLTADNERFVNTRVLSMMKRTALLINVARGGLIDEHDLAAALNAGTIAGAGVDVIAHEPMRPDSPLRTAERCVFTPHIAWASVAARRRLIEMAAEDVRSFLAGSPQHVVNEGALRAHFDDMAGPCAGSRAAGAKIPPSPRGRTMAPVGTP